jgi:hypothetical protein
MWLSARQKKSAVRPATSKASHSETTILSILATEHLIPPMTTNMARLKADRITRGTTVGSTTTPGTATRCTSHRGCLHVKGNLIVIAVDEKNS